MRRESSVSVLTAALLAALGIAPIAARAATIVVTTTGDSGTASDCTLRQAIQSMNTGAVAGTGCVVASGAFGTGDTVQFGTTAFPAGGANTITLAGGELVISTDLGIDATANSNVTIDANKASRVMDDNAASGTLTLSHLTLRNGQAAYGGGIHTKTVNITLNSSTLSGNTAVGTNFTTGGGIYSYGTNITLNNSTVSGNSATFGGGGIYDDGGKSNFTVTLNNSTVSGNSAQKGGGINVNVANAYAARVTLNNSTVSGNSATSTFNVLGGGIYVYKGKVYLTNSTLSGNSADGASAVGGGLTIARGDSSTVASYNTIFATNSAATGSDIAVIFASLTFTITGSNNLLFGGGSSSLSQASFNNAPMTGNPKLTPLAHFGGPTKTRFPLAGSAAVNVISAASCKTTTDQRGYARPDAGSTSATPCDIGAVEADAATRNDIIFINGLDL